MTEAVWGLIRPASSGPERIVCLADGPACLDQAAPAG